MSRDESSQLPLEIQWFFGLGRFFLLGDGDLLLVFLFLALHHINVCTAIWSADIYSASSAFLQLLS